jgi:hypothetical protein
MEAKDFNKIVESVHKECKATLINRAKFYADEDRFRNFKNVARIKNTDKYDALLGMFLKHYEAWINFMEKDPKDTPIEQWREKIIDMINYLTLCLGMAIEDIESE